jgi:hypothetical protein
MSWAVGSGFTPNRSLASGDMVPSLGGGTAAFGQKLALGKDGCALSFEFSLSLAKGVPRFTRIVSKAGVTTASVILVIGIGKQPSGVKVNQFGVDQNLAHGIPFFQAILDSRISAVDKMFNPGGVIRNACHPQGFAFAGTRRVFGVGGKLASRNDFLANDFLHGRMLDVVSEDHYPNPFEVDVFHVAPLGGWVLDNLGGWDRRCRLRQPIMARVPRD